MSADIALLEVADDPTAPAVGYRKIYAKTTGVHTRDSDGNVQNINPVNDNFIINSDMIFAQRGTSFVSIAHTSYPLDRYQYRKSGTMVHDTSQSTDVPTYAQSGHMSLYSMKIDCTTAQASIGAAEFCIIDYLMEGYDYQRLKEKTCTLSFWVKATKTGTYCVSFSNNGSDRTYVCEYTINVSNTWEKKTVTVTFNQTGGTESYINALGLRIRWALAIGSSLQGTAGVWNSANYLSTSNQVNACDNTDNNFWLAQVKLEVGPYATAFKTRGIGYEEEFSLCRRYYQETGGIWGVAIANNIVTGFQFEQRMRDTPTIISVISDLSTVGKISNVAGTDVGNTLSFPMNTAYCVRQINDSGTAFTANAFYSFRFKLSAEL